MDSNENNSNLGNISSSQNENNSSTNKECELNSSASLNNNSNNLDITKNKIHDNTNNVSNTHDESTKNLENIDINFDSLSIISKKSERSSSISNPIPLPQPSQNVKINEYFTKARQCENTDKIKGNHYYQEAYNLNRQTPKENLLLEFATSCYNIGEKAKAVPIFEQLLTVKPTHCRANLLLGATYNELGICEDKGSDSQKENFSKAIKHLEAGIGLPSAEAPYFGQLINVLLKMNEHEKAEIYYKKLIKKYPAQKVIKNWDNLRKNLNNSNI